MDLATPPSEAPVYPDQIQPGCRYDPADDASVCTCPLAHPVLAIVLRPVWAVLGGRVQSWVCCPPCWHRPPPGHPTSSPSGAPDPRPQPPRKEPRMKHHPKRRQVGTGGLVLRFRNGICTHQCRRCGQWEAFPRWRPALRSARAHATDHAAGATDRYTLTPAGSRLVGRPQPRWRRSLRRRLAAVLAVLVLAVLAFTVTVTAVTSRAAPPAPAPAPAIGIAATTTTAAGPGPEGYRPTPASPPATDRQGQWIPDPDPTSSSAGGGR
jgi:hypothetical protein